ncbi:MAG TPA: hypothetical protein VNE63_04995 [Candidatus Acidoferrales bacterium]|nr:hypothetical protein [Candidatus Acidoferrales bacterium]
MQKLSVQIVRFVGNHQLGLVACDLVDAEGRRHVFIDKIPIFTIDLLTQAVTIIRSRASCAVKS